MPDELAQFIGSSWPLRRWIVGTGSILAGGSVFAWWLGGQIVTATTAVNRLTATIEAHTDQLAELKTGQTETRTILQGVARTLSDEAAAISKLQGYNDGRRGDIGPVGMEPHG